MPQTSGNGATSPASDSVRSSLIQMIFCCYLHALGLGFFWTAETPMKHHHLHPSLQASKESSVLPPCPAEERLNITVPDKRTSDQSKQVISLTHRRPDVRLPSFQNLSATVFGNIYKRFLFLMPLETQIPVKNQTDLNLVESIL